MNQPSPTTVISRQTAFNSSFETSTDQKLTLDNGDWFTMLSSEKAMGYCTPFMLTDLSIVKNRCNAFKKLFPGVALFYAVKAYSDKEIVRAIDDIVDGYDAASPEEIRTLLSEGIDARRITYSNPVKPESAIADAAKAGIEMFAFQSREELEKIARHASDAKVFVRVKMDDSHSAVPLSVKYGCAPQECIELLAYAQKLGLQPCGVTFHVGSQQTGLVEWHKAIKTAQNLVNRALTRGMKLEVINMGGGFPVEYAHDGIAIDLVATKVVESVCNDKEVSYMAEPGRFIVADSSAIVATIIGVEKRDGKRWLYLDVGLFQAFIGAMRFDPFLYPPFSMRHMESSTKGDTESYVLTGPTCDSHDIITSDAELPADMKTGDKIVFPKTGAYTIVYGSNFNGFKIPKRYFVDDANTEASEQ